MDELKPLPMSDAEILTIRRDVVADSLYASETRLGQAIVAARDAQWLSLVGELQRDAERYRWLRDALSDRSRNGVSHYFCSISEGYPEELDFAIDSVFAARGEKGGV